MSHLPIAHQPPARGNFSGDSQPAKDRARSSTPAGSPLLRSDPSVASGNAANTTQRNSSADDQTAKGAQRSGGADAALAKVGNGLPAVGEPAAGVAEPFSELLARQIGETVPLTPITVQDTSAFDLNAATTEDTSPTATAVQDQTAIGANASGDTASILAAMLLQIPAVQGREQRTKEADSLPLTAEGTPRSSGDSTGLPLAGARSSGELRSMPVGDLQLAAGVSTPSENPLPMAERRAQTDTANLIPLSTEMVELAEPATIPASMLQTGTAQTITPLALSAAMPSMLNHNAAGTTQSITTPLGSNVWAEEFTQKISWMLTQQNQVAELHLNPPDLGPLDVVLKISGNQATVLFTSPHGAVRDAVENALPKLREILADNGIMLGNATVSDHPPQYRGPDGNMNQGFGTAAQRALLDEASNSTGMSPENSQAGPTRRHNGMVDTFA